MGIELESIGSAISSTVGAVGRVGGSFGRGLEAFGPSIGPVSLPINESPAGILGMENTMTLATSKSNQFAEYIPIGQVTPDLGGEARPFSLLDTITLASNPFLPPEVQPEAVVAQVQLAASPNLAEGMHDVQIEPLVFPQVEPMVAPAIVVQPDFWPIPDITLSPTVEAQVDSQPGAKNKTAFLVSPATTPQTELKEEEVEEVVEQIAQPEEEDTSETEETEISKTKIVESVKTSQERRNVIITAVKKAIQLGITVKEALPDRFWKLTSPLVKEGKDWTIDLTANELNIDPARFSNVKQIEQAVIESVANNIPVEEGAEGRQATIGEVRKVTHGEDNKLRPKTPAEIVKRRTIKKKVVVSKTKQGWTVIANQAETTQENTLKDLNLEEVFQRAA